MHLYTFEGAPNPKRLQYFLQYKGIQIETTVIDLMKGEQFSPEFSALNPWHTVPCLKLEDGNVLTEVIGICAFLESEYPDAPLLGETPLQRAQVLSWDHILYVHLYEAVAEILRNGNENFADRALPGPANIAQIPQLVERGRQRLKNIWPALDKQLAEHQWVAGDCFSLADIDLLCIEEFCGWVKESVPADCTTLHRLLTATRERLNL